MNSGMANLLVRTPTPQVEPTLETVIERAAHALMDLQHADGHWVFELEADATIPAEYVLLQHYLGSPDAER